jgi:4-hydroxy-tetrahydrodipicolinate synthase
METATATLDNIASPKLLPGGVWPVAVTPFKANGAIDWKAYDQLLDWYMVNGSSGIFAVCLSSEFYDLTGKEKEKLAAVAVKRCSGRIPVVAGGGLGRNLRETVKSVNAIGALGVDAVVVPVNQLVTADQNDTELLRQIDLLVSLTGDIPLGLYECPAPYHRLISEDIMRYCAQTGRFRFLKDTCCDAKEIGRKVAAGGKTGFSLYNANIETLLDSMALGCRGYNGPAANFYPDLIDVMMHSKEPEKISLLRDIVISGQRVVTYKYLATAKLFLKFSGVDISGYCRRETPSLTRHEIEAIKSFFNLINYWRQELA